MDIFVYRLYRKYIECASTAEHSRKLEPYVDGEDSFECYATTCGTTDVYPFQNRDQATATLLYTLWFLVFLCSCCCCCKAICSESIKQRKEKKKWEDDPEGMYKKFKQRRYMSVMNEIDRLQNRIKTQRSVLSVINDDETLNGDGNDTDNKSSKNNSCCTCLKKSDGNDENETKQYNIIKVDPIE